MGAAKRSGPYHIPKHLVGEVASELTQGWAQGSADFRGIQMEESGTGVVVKRQSSVQQKEGPYPQGHPTLMVTACGSDELPVLQVGMPLRDPVLRGGW